MEQPDTKPKFPVHEKIQLSLEEKKAMDAPRPRQVKPYKIEGLVPGKKYAWCACGLSSKDVSPNSLIMIALL